MKTTARNTMIRSVLFSLVSLVFSAAVSAADAYQIFPNGVSSSAKSSGTAMISSKLSPTLSSSKRPVVRWEISNDQNFSTLFDKGHTRPTPDTDYAINIDIDTLEANQVYFYRFKHNGLYSAVGQIITVSSSRLAMNL